MKLHYYFVIVFIVFFTRLSYAQVPPEPRTQFDVNESGDDMVWWRTSMETRSDRIEWWKEARFGMFVHWGVYSPLGGEYNGKRSGYAEHIQRVAKIYQKEYIDEVVKKFNPVDFDADKWIKALKDAGMRYFIITSKHHDGFAMYDSDVSDFNIVKATPFGRDPMKELKASCVKYGIKFGFYYSHAFDWGEKDGAGNDWEFENPGGDRHLYGGRNWFDPHPEVVPRIRDNYVNTKSIPQVVELIKKYDPDIMWFDTSHKLPPEELARILKAARLAKPDLVINSRLGGPGNARRWGDYTSTVDRPAEFYPTASDWEGIPTTNESYGWSKFDKSHKPASFFIRLLAKAVARGGNTLMNIGPMGNGLIDPVDLNILKGIGDWMDVNHASIRGAGRTPLPVQSWGESTRKGDLLFLHVFSWPENGELILSGLKSDIKMAWLLSDADKKNLPVKTLSNVDKMITVPGSAPDNVDAVIVLQVEAKMDTDPRRLLSVTQKNRLHVFDGELVGDGLKYGGGRRANDYILGWSTLNQSIFWNTRIAQSGTFNVIIEYSGVETKNQGSYKVQIGSEVLKGNVESTKDEKDRYKKIKLGSVTLSQGDCPVRVIPVDIPGEELMRLRAVHLIPVEK